MLLCFSFYFCTVTQHSLFLSLFHTLSSLRTDQQPEWWPNVYFYRFIPWIKDYIIETIESDSLCSSISMWMCARYSFMRIKCVECSQVHIHAQCSFSRPPKCIYLRTYYKFRYISSTDEFAIWNVCCFFFKSKSKHFTFHIAHIAHRASPITYALFSIHFIGLAR